MERTLCLFKPDAVRRGLIGEILHRFERAGLKIIALKLLQATAEQAGRHYTYEDIVVRHGEAVRNQLIAFLTSSPIVALALEGNCAVEVVRKICGSTEPTTAPVGTIRGDYAHHSFAHGTKASKSVYNLVHASANAEDAALELAVWFTATDFLSYHRDDECEHNLTL